MSRKDGKLDYHARRVLDSNPEFFGTPETWDPKRRRQQEDKMAKGILSIDDVGRDNPYEDIPTLTKEEALTVVAERAYNQALLLWGEGVQHHRLTINDRIAGAVYSTFEMLQNGVEGLMPAFDLLPVALPHFVPSVYVERGENEIQARWTEDPISLSGMGDDVITMTSVFSDVYDRYKDRLAASARDLFQPYD
jgi:hypothetical protein